MAQPQNFRKYLAKLNFIFQSIAKLTSADLTKSNSPYNTQFHATQPLQFIYILNGSLTIKHQAHEYDLVAGDYCLLYLNETTTCENLSDDLEFYEIRISSVNLHELLDKQNEQIFSYFTDSNQLILGYMELIAKENPETNKIVQQMLLEALFTKIIRDQNIELIELPAHQSHREVESVKQYIHAHFGKNITLDELADLTGMNKYYLVHIFKRDTGKSPIDFLIHVRIEEAKSLLSNSTLPIAKISESVGFASQSYFSKMFKRQTQMSPSQFRKTYAGGLLTTTVNNFSTPQAADAG